jgi:penicillin-binding protein
MKSFFQKNEQSGRKKWMYIGIAIASIFLLLAFVLGYRYWTEKQRKEQANEASDLFIEALETQNYEQLITTLSPTSLEEIDYTTEEVQERYETIYGGVGVNNVTADNIELIENEESEDFTLRYDLHLVTSLGELEPQSYETTLEEAEDHFAVDWGPHLIFPEMDPGDTVQIQFTAGERGNIFDRNGELLAGEGSAQQAGLYPALLGEGEEREENLQEIAEAFDTPIDQLENLLAAEWVTDESFVPFTYVDEEEPPELAGVMYQETTTRTYPLGEAGAHLLGYIGEVFAEDIEANPELQPGDIIGKAGLEATFDERLRGDKGGQINILDQSGEEKKTVQEAPVQDGEDIHLTIDSSLQQLYFDGLEDKSGGAVVMAPTSGELLVLTSAPSYDPIAMTQGISQEAYEEYMDDPETPFLSRYAARYAPASTFKAITAAVGLDSGVTDLDKTRTITGLDWQKDESWGNHKVTRVSDQLTEVDLEDAMVYSDNIFFAQEALEMGAETFMNGLEEFPFGQDFDLPIQMEPAQITNSGSFDSEALLADTAYGQGQLLMSPIHQIVFYSPFANEGELVFPKLELEAETTESIQPVTSETAATIKELLIQVVDNPNGTGHVLEGSSPTLGAKTGTGEVQAAESENGNDINGFLYAFDAEESSFSSLVFIENEWGSDVAEQFAPIIKQHE